MTNDTTRLFVLTGGPGSGKTAVIDELAARGYACLAEAGRAVIQQQAANDGSALPWADRALFAERMLMQDLESYRNARRLNGAVFFDRGFPDVAGYLRLSRLPVGERVAKAVEQFRYNRLVFIAPPWREIFHADEERKQDFAESVQTFEAMQKTYAGYGYALVEMPKVSVKERADFVLDAARPNR